MSRFLRLSALAAGLMLAGAVQADVTLNYNSAQQGSSKIQVSGGKVRIDSPARNGHGSVVLFDAASQTMTTLIPSKHEYVQMDKAAVDKMSQEVGDMMTQARARMQQQLANMPPEQRKMMEQEMAKMGGSPLMSNGTQPEPFSAKPSGRHGSAAGVDCEWISVYQGSKMLNETCVAPAGKVGVDGGDYATMQTMFSFMSDMAEKMSKAAGSMSGNMQDIMLAEKQGVPVINRDLGHQLGGADGGTTRLQSVDHGHLSADLFTIPAGYRKVDPFAQMHRR